MVFFTSKMISKTLLIRLKTPRLAAPMSTLIGPPEMHSFISQLKMQTLPETPAVDPPFVDSVASDSSNTQSPKPPMGLTENLSPTYLSSGNPCLDFFFDVVPGTPFEHVQEGLQKAWNHDPLTSLKLTCNLRGVRGTGKSDKEGFYASALWLHQFHPRTLAGNVSAMVNFGYMKDLPEILYRLLEGSDVRKTQNDEWLRINGRSMLKYYNQSKTKKHYLEGSISSPEMKSNREMRILNALERDKLLKEKAALLREEKRTAMAKKVLERYHTDSAFRVLYERVSDFFAESLKADMEHLKSNETTKVSLAAKWCPSLDSSFDKSMFLCESIARKIFPRESYPEYEGLEESHYVYRIRDRLRKEVLVPLRKVLELPETYMSFNKWGQVQYNRVASVAMDLYKDKFLEHDKERFEKYLADVESGKSKIASGALLPHEIIQSLDGEGGKVAELQWKSMVEDLLKQGKLRNCMAISDVSGSMEGIPMEVSVALGLLISELSEEPWKGKLITFSADPTLHVVQGETLSEKIESIRNMGWGMNTDFQKVFDLILEVAVNGKLKEEDMIKRLFVFSDMEFDEASGNPHDSYGPYDSETDDESSDERSWETDYEAIVRKFTEKGYGNAVPEIVFWNLRYSSSTPVDEGQKGVALVSGHSKNLMKLFLNGDGVVSPVRIMEAAISREEYQSLSVFD